MKKSDYKNVQIGGYTYIYIDGKNVKTKFLSKEIVNKLPENLKLGIVRIGEDKLNDIINKIECCERRKHN